MKRLIILILLFPLFILAQEKEIEFTKKFTYKGVIYYPDTLQVNIFYSDQGLLVERILVSEHDYNFIANSEITTLKVNFQTEKAYSIRETDTIAYAIKKLNKNEIIQNMNCTYYETLEDNDGRTEFCMTEDYPVSFYPYFMKNPDREKIKGIPLKINFNNEFLIFKSVEDVSFTLYIDFNEINWE